MKIQESAENYLETILIIGNRLSLEYSSLKQFRQSLWLTDIFLSTCYIFYIGYVDLY